MMQDPTDIPVRVFVLGLGPIGIMVLRNAVERSTLEVVGGCDLRRDAIGQDLGTLAGGHEIGAVVYEDLELGLAETRPDVLVQCTGSRVRSGLAGVIGAVKMRANVVSTCEELAYPWTQHSDEAQQIDRAAREAGVTVLGTGVNPGYAMDYLPLVASSICRSVDGVSVHRVQDAGDRRLPLRAKVGVGLSSGEFDDGVRLGRIGHVGLRESAYALATALGWRISLMDEDITPVIADRDIVVGDTIVLRGRVAGIRQVVCASDDKRERVRLVLEMAVGLSAFDDVVLTGQPGVHLRAPEGLQGDHATAAIVVNAIERVIEARPGLITMRELPPPTPGALRPVAKTED